MAKKNSEIASVLAYEKKIVLSDGLYVWYDMG